MKISRLFQALMILALGLAPQSLFACSVCFTGREGFMEAFYATTALLIILPPTILGSIGYLFYRSHKKALKEQEK